MAKQVNYFKVVSLPASLQPSSFYFAKGAVDTAFKMYLTSDSATPAAIPLDAVPNARTITAGTGLSGGGDLSSNKTISLNLAYTDARYSRLDFDNTFTKHNHFDNALSIPSIAPTGPHGSRTYIHFGAIGSGGTTPPLVANLTDLQDVAISPAQQAADGVVSWSTAQGKFIIGTPIGAYIPLSQKGTPNGVATLGSDGLIFPSQLPSYVDDVIEVATIGALPATGEAGKIYVVTTAGTHGGTSFPANSQFRWTGSAYVRLVASPGTTDNVVEGTSNLYFTTARARAAISAGSGLSYTASTGVLSVNRSVVDTWYSAAGHTHTFASLTSKPTTLSGYGITDAVASSRTITAGTGLTGGGALSGNITLNVSYGTTAGTAAQGNDSRINNGQTAFGWGDHRNGGYWDIKTNTGYASFLDSDIDKAVAGDIGLATSIYGGANVPWHQSDVVTKSQYTGTDLLQLAFPFRDNKRFHFRNKYGATGVWTEWYEIFHTGNLSEREHTWTAHNHFDSAISIPAVAPTGPHADKTYLHFGDVGTGGSTPPLVANLSDLQDVTITGAATGQVLQWNGTKWINSTVPLDLSGYVQKATQVIAGTGLTGGGTLTQDRTLNVDFGTTAGKVAQGNHTHTFASLTSKPTTVAGYGITNAALNTISITAGTGLTGGGTLAATRTLNVSYGTTAGTAAQGNDSRINNGQTAFDWGDWRTPTMRYKSTITGGEDLDNFVEIGLYAISSSQAPTVLNKPYEGSQVASLRVYYANAYVTQIYSVVNLNLFYRRSKNSTAAWSPWVQEWDSDSLRSDTQNDARYLQLSGGTMSGDLDMSSNSPTKLTLNRTGTLNNSIRFQHSGVDSFYLGSERSGKFVIAAGADLRSDPWFDVDSLGASVLKDATSANHLPRLSQVQTLITNATSWSQEAW